MLWGALGCRLADTSVTSATAAFAVDNVSVTTVTIAVVDDDVSQDCVDHVPPAWGSPARDAPCLEMPPLPQAGDGPLSSERLLRARDLDFHAHDQLRFRHLPREEAVANIASHGF